MMLGPQLALAACCIALGLAGPWTLGALTPAVSVVLGTAPSESAGTHLLEAGLGLRGVALASTVLATVGVALALLRRRLLASRVVTTSVTWDCGYAAPTARMQYSASSFAQPLVDLFHAVLRTHTDAPSPDGLFPEATVFASHTPDTCREGFYRPLFVGIGRGLGSLRRFQHGNLHLYVLYIAVTMLVLLIWALG